MMIEVTLAQGRSPEQIDALGKALTTAAEETLGVRPEAVRVIVRELNPAHWFVAGVSFAELRANGQR
ncbi:tautomerase family protein [Mycobacterium marseillense]|uniref:tautomerase family protein n=1 Tax=Mycobacterium marseillense TaxID=701042 RepID=UPI002597C7BA|nr:tautomerase family protein [Mycobacterium marseillense]MDM3975300.1 tautomerase family protein [Mycobacterium marseillense]